MSESQTDPHWNHDDADRLAARIWAALRQAVDDDEHPFRWPVVGTVDGDAAAQRIVILRDIDVDGRTLTFHTDARSAKIAQIRACPRLSWLFYDPSCRVQLRITGPATIHHADDYADAVWPTLHPGQKTMYCRNPAPGAELDAPGDGLTDALRGRDVDEAAVEPGRANFAVVVGRIERLELLHLRRSGHRRIEWRTDGGRLVARWVSP